MTIHILAILAGLTVALVAHLVHRKATDARLAREAQFEQEDAIRIHDAARKRQEWIAGVMKEYDAPVPTENVPNLGGVQ